jgi:hypothetical protein
MSAQILKAVSRKRGQRRPPHALRRTRLNVEIEACDEKHESPR